MAATKFRIAALIGIGEMGGVFARALLRSGHIVVPVTRESDIADAAAAFPEPEIALIAVGETDLPGAMMALPDAWKDRVGLLQNELLPADWVRAGIDDPTVIVAWFEKKPGQDVKVIIPSPVGGPYADAMQTALATIGIPAQVVAGPDLTSALVTKNLYILTANIAGLVTGGTVHQLWHEHRELADEVADEVLDIQEWLVGAKLDREAHVRAMQAAVSGDPDHKATGRSAPARLARALENAAAAGIDVPRLEDIAARHGNAT